MRTETDALLRSCLAMLDDPARPDAQKAALARSQLTLVLARRRAARLRRANDRLLCAYADAAMAAQGRPDPYPETKGA